MPTVTANLVATNFHFAAAVSNSTSDPATVTITKGTSTVSTVTVAEAMADFDALYATHCRNRSDAMDAAAPIGNAAPAGTGPGSAIGTPAMSATGIVLEMWLPCLK